MKLSSELQMPKHARKTLTEEEQEAFAYELALGYYTEEELRKVFKLLPEGMRSYMTSPNMEIRVMQMRREIDGSPQAMRIHARRAARLAIDNLNKILIDDEAPAKTRIEAGRQLREYAMVADKEALADPDADSAVIIRTNLDMGDARGVYTITSEEIEEQASDEPQSDTEDSDSDEDWSALLGVDE